MFIKVHQSYRQIVAICDSDIIGKKFEEDRLQLDLTKKFYHGEAKNKEEVKKIMMTARHLHLTGKGTVAIAAEMNLVNPKKIIFIDNIPHAEIMNE